MVIVAEKREQFIMPWGMEGFQEKMTLDLGLKVLVGFFQAKKERKGIPNMNESMENWQHVLLGQEVIAGNELGIVYGTRIMECGR